MTGCATARAIFEFSEEFNDDILQVEMSRGAITTLINGLDGSNRDDIKLALMIVEKSLQKSHVHMRDLQTSASKACQKVGAAT